jgi:hypothetical protein
LAVNGGEFLPRGNLISQIYSLHSNITKNLSSDGEIEIKIEVGASAVYTGERCKDVSQKSSANAEVECFGGSALVR